MSLDLHDVWIVAIANHVSDPLAMIEKRIAVHFLNIAVRNGIVFG